MNVSYNWLKDYVKTDHSPNKLCEILTDTGLEVDKLEKVESIKGSLEGVVIGEVIECFKHENADRLKVTIINIGQQKELQIVCGAPNVEKGQKVVVATVGTTLYPTPDEPFKIKKSKIRGVESFGMLCAEDELGLGASHDGIIVLPKKATVGQSASHYFNVSTDYRISIDLTPNRSDAISHIGVARDIVAYNKIHKLEKGGLRIPDVNNYKVIESGEKVSIKVEDKKNCGLYYGCVISSMTISPSPDWLQNYLRTVGLIPVNNVVDVTNYVMYELGTPLHAFDLKVVGNEVVVKKANPGDKFVTLDGEERELSGEDLMITNGKTNLCIAGVYGGEHSGVKEETTSIFLEAAYFNPVSIRKTAKRHGLNTDASYRFERGVDPMSVQFAMKRAATLIKELTGGTVSNEPIPVTPFKPELNEIMFDYERCSQIAGNDIDSDVISEILNTLDIEIAYKNGNQAKLKIPTYRVDVTREADVIEEILRIYGYNNIQLPEKWNISLTDQNLRLEENKKDTIADLLVANGMYEIMNNSLTSSEIVDNCGEEVIHNDHSVYMLNPLSNDLNVLRQTLVFQGIQTVAYNINHQNFNVGLFEFGKVYKKFKNEYIENKRLAVFLTGNIEKEQWNANQNAVSFFTLKGIITAVMDRLGLDPTINVKPLKKSIFTDGVQIYVQKKKLGELGWLSKRSMKYLGVKQMVYVADIDWDMILSLDNENSVKYKSLPKTFAIRRDFSLLIDKKVKFREIVDIATKTNKSLLKEVNLFDVYEGDNLPNDKKSYAVSFTFQHDEKTLTDKQIDKIMDKIYHQLKKQLAVELR